LTQRIHYVARIAHVREVALLGPADLAYWAQRLRDEELVPTDRDGRAQVLVVAARMRFMGMRFTELSVSVLASDSGGRSGAFLVQAFSSNRFFAFMERSWFRTPYLHATPQVTAESPAGMELLDGQDTAFSARMAVDAATPRTPARTGDDGWEGPVFLPRPAGRPGAFGHIFFGKLRGLTQTYPFVSGQDAVTIRPTPRMPALQALCDSRFAGREWSIRPDASHAKSRTYARAALPDLCWE
jgi:hypothetical protein